MRRDIRIAVSDGESPQVTASIINDGETFVKTSEGVMNSKYAQIPQVNANVSIKNQIIPLFFILNRYHSNEQIYSVMPLMIEMSKDEFSGTLKAVPA